MLTFAGRPFLINLYLFSIQPNRTGNPLDSQASNLSLYPS